MRGYDVTERVNDAWGVRDSLGQGVLLSSGYASEMTKPRRPTTRLLPPVSEHLQVTDRYRSYHDGEPSLGHYELRAGNPAGAAKVYDGWQIDWSSAQDRFKAVRIAVLEATGQSEAAKALRQTLAGETLRPEETDLLEAKP